jgi:GT2 family glycosyltransferase
VTSFCIIIPNYNGALFIKTTVDAFVCGFPDTSIIVVDDASTDDSITVLSDTEAKVIVRKKNGGFAAAVNTGLRDIGNSNYDFVLVANSDLVLDMVTCRKIASVLPSNDENKKIAVFGFLEENNSSIPVDSDISGFIFFLRLDVQKKIGYLDEAFFMYGEEQDYFRRVIKAGFTICQSGVHVKHESEGSSKIGLRNSWLAIRNSIYLEAKNYSWWYMARTSGVLFLMINRLYTPATKNDPSVRRVLRPGVIIGNIFLVSAVFWNIYNMLEKLLAHDES